MAELWNDIRLPEDAEEVWITFPLPSLYGGPPEGGFLRVVRTYFPRWSGRTFTVPGYRGLFFWESLS